MKAMILDPQVKVYSSMDANTVSLMTLPMRSEIEMGSMKRKSGKLWMPIILSTGQKAFIPGETKVFFIQQGSLMQDNVDMHAEPSVGSSVKQKLARKTKVSVLEVIKEGETRWVKIRDLNGIEGYISGDTRIHVTPQRTKAMGMRNITSGVMWLIAASILFFMGEKPAPGSINYLFGYAALVFGGIILISGIVQYFKARA